MTRSGAAGSLQRPPGRLGSITQIVRAAGMRYALGAIRRQLWDTRVYLGLRCDLRELPPVPAAQVPVEMVERDVDTYAGFHAELDRVRGSDAYETLLRIWSCQAGIRTLLSAELGGEPVYCQWLVRAYQQAAIQRHSPGSYGPLPPDEVLLEGAYTFTAFRGKRAMAAGMSQLLHIARGEGGIAATTYVAADNVPSLKGCARVGFELDHQRVTVLRFGRRRSRSIPVDDVARAAWERATG